MLANSVVVLLRWIGDHLGVAIFADKSAAAITVFRCDPIIFIMFTPVIQPFFVFFPSPTLICFVPRTGLLVSSAEKKPNQTNLLHPGHILSVFFLPLQ